MLSQALSRVVAVQPLLDAVERDQADPRAAFAQFLIGQLVTGKVLGHHRDLTLVRIENHTVAMRLPRHAAQGETLKLSFAGHMPQPVFVLEAGDAQTSSVPQLSQTARMLSEIMQRVPERSLPTLTPPAPLLDTPPASPTELAIALRGALVRSGLFYESHLANWAAGRDSLEGLLREPQNRLSGEPAALAAADAGGKASHPLHTLLTQQLQVLETPQFAWRGELWPGQPLEWELQREPDARDGQAASHTPASDTWRSRLRVTLPTLGEIDIELRLDAQQAFAIRIIPTDADSLLRLRDSQPHLNARLLAAGLNLAALDIRPDEHA
ncbi:MAG: flagellar hook-length control protein FliK [Hydrogenophilales bacterium 16-64-46]|nr:MAG: flagellar hook-length control protein FliK [Hydrogenophilales bacterium 12-64-13]OYZ04112.1 MAG: flagellar hook-length control protein FliK [Hydrogenophilales bacterium 16-64-46]OZA36861.1 MAG: flagellar hook-length control protein FliK [Hydrogenophilales bacterium 17-64-34]HQT00026.1 flagellar hook-length control protein FliK [Thiobacillus sp.]